MKADIQGEIRIKCFLPSCSGGSTDILSKCKLEGDRFFCMTIQFLNLSFIL